jgi:hypothetical protein
MLAGGFVRPCNRGSTPLLPLRGVLPLAVLFVIRESRKSVPLLALNRGTPVNA